jgi:chromosome segregation ATPase
MSDPIPTPLVDAAAYDSQPGNPMVPNGCAVIPADFAREFERALIEMTKERDSYKTIAEKYEDRYFSTLKERDDVKAESDHAVRALAAVIEAKTAERDAAFARAEKAESDDNDTRLNLNDALNECDTLRVRISELEKDRERLHAVTCLLEERDSLRSAFEKLERSLDNEADVDDGKPNDAMRFLTELRAIIAATDLRG